MNSNLKKRWIGALRSGEYKQGKDTFKNSKEEHCCLGVLCEIMSEKELNFYKIEIKNDRINTYFSYDKEKISQSFYSKGKFHNNTLDKLGISIKKQDTLVYFNDVEDKSFLEIADYIEKEL